MPILLSQLVNHLNPSNCSLVLGAGASVPSGGPTGAELAKKLWSVVANEATRSNDLVTTASLLVRKYSRRAVVDVVVGTLKDLRPTGGLLALPSFPWSKIFTTNFDRLIEKSYTANSKPLSVIRSNYDFTYQENNPSTRLYKIHGCISQDESLGHRASMILTEQDYESHLAYRQSLFAELKSAMLSGDILVIGQSLEDHHLSDLVKEVLKAKPQGAPGHVYVLVYNQDDLRAPLLEDRGARVCFSGIDEFLHALSVGSQKPSLPIPTAVSSILPPSLVSTVIDVSHARTLSPNVTRMFNGGPASYADIESRATFDRSQTSKLIEELTSGIRIAITIIGAAGVGKTTLARQIVLVAVEHQLHAWEHKIDFQFQADAWLSVESEFRNSNKRAVLFVDECVHYMRAVNSFVDALAKVPNPSITLVLTANSALWTPRVKSPHIYRLGTVVQLSRLDYSEIGSLINLVEHNPQIASLVHPKFKQKQRDEQREILNRKSSADMFVCLNNIFQTEGLDTILLREYEDIESGLQEYYRYVAALEAVGAKVHRQLLIRMLNAPPEQISRVLVGLSGIVDEYDIRPKEGIYGWSTRHLVIARKITEYKFSSIEELEKLFDTIIDNLNPGVAIELQTIRDICDRDFGIGRLGDANMRQKLYRRLISVAPAERIPWHRLIRELIQAEDYGEAEYTIRRAEEVVSADAPLSRYKVRLLVSRAKYTPGISEGDRVALLRKAYEQATSNIEHYQWDKFSYAVLCDVAVSLIERGESVYVLDEAIIAMRQASERIVDPEMDRKLREYEMTRNNLFR